MEENKQLDDLLIKYLSNELSEQERIFVNSWIKEDSKNADYFERLKNAWILLGINHSMGKIDPDKEWLHFKRIHFAGHLKVVPNDKQDEFGKETEENARLWKRKVKRVFILSAVAASVLYMILSGSTFFFRNEASRPILRKTAIHKNESELSPVRKEFNLTDKPRKLKLEDGSELVLYANTCVSFHEPFATNKRELNLVGKADFKIAKDETRPFIVFTDNISTTALGTKFTISGYNEDNKISVRLFEGRVVIKNTEASKKLVNKQYYLSPGNELLYDKKTFISEIRNFKINKAIAKKSEKIKSLPPIDSPSFPTNNDGSWYMFNNQSLDEVFDQLAIIFGTKIHYSEKEIEKMYFIAKFKRSDSLKNILKDIAHLNNLKVTIKDNEYTITVK